MADVVINSLTSASALGKTFEVRRSTGRLDSARPTTRRDYLEMFAALVPDAHRV